MRRTLACLGSLTAVSGKVYFSETFDDSWESRWVKSEWKKSEGTAGDFTLSAGKFFADEKEDKGLMTSQDARFYDISASFDSFSNAGKDLIIQYQAKYEKDIECGGGYIKVGPKMADGGKSFGDPTAYNIMFGPDKCGYTKRTHVIFSYKDKKVLKTTDLTYRQDSHPEGATHLYRMILRPNNTVRVDIDEEKYYDGDIKEDWEVLKPKEISDPDDKKPDDWSDESMIDDPEDKKPDDWVEEKRIVDAEAKKPDDWDDEEDGDWEPPMKDNPDFKGAWHVKTIPNPAYKGYWEPRMIANPEFEDDDSIYQYDFGFVGIDLWQEKANTIFDNIIITDNVAEADAFAAKWLALNTAEKYLKDKAEKDKEEAERRKREEENPPMVDEEEDYEKDDETL
mmetsp:Transcript_131165/g.213520  ORF Transcript_131165/g.213520 Transcript_131165/m.213520 type:complete len:395 (-) Transcript_131165:91-1275(-)